METGIDRLMDKWMEEGRERWMDGGRGGKGWMEEGGRDGSWLNH